MTKKIEAKIEWFKPDEFPEEIGQNGFSVDVHVYIKNTNEYQVAWFEYSTMKWHFLCNEQHIEDFEWRYFNNLIDKPNGKKRRKKRK